jgi:outer membrane lipoprotein LolB
MDHEFNIEGKLAIRGALARHSARFRWSQTGEAYRIELWGPLGHGRTILEGNGRKLTVRDGGGKVLESGAVYAVMQKQLGWYLPLEALPRWVQGGPIEELPVSGPMIDGQGRMIAFDQLGWRLGFTYPNVEIKSPTRIRAVRGDYQVLLVLTTPAVGGPPGSAWDSRSREVAVGL